MATRREFVGGAARALAGSALAGASASLLDSCRSKPPLFEATVDVASLVSQGQSLVTPGPGFDGAPILVVRRTRQRWLALSMQCTHEGCPVNPPAGQVITCPCHGSQYDLEGRVLRGPAQFPLARYTTAYDGRSRRLTVRIDG